MVTRTRCHENLFFYRFYVRLVTCRVHLLSKSVKNLSKLMVTSHHVTPSFLIFLLSLHPGISLLLTWSVDDVIHHKCRHLLIFLQQSASALLHHLSRAGEQIHDFNAVTSSTHRARKSSSPKRIREVVDEDEDFRHKMSPATAVSRLVMTSLLLDSSETRLR